MAYLESPMNVMEKKTPFGPLDEPLQGLDAKTCPLAQPLHESRRPITNWREGGQIS